MTLNCERILVQPSVKQEFMDAFVLEKKPDIDDE